ncbi:putative phage tail protein [Vibrio phage 191E37-1]|nr:putative phage tail protein [Vibrio phage 191E37-1]
MSDLDNAINSINASAAKAENTATFLDDMSTFDDQSSVTNPNNGQTVASIPKQVKDRTDELFTAAESDINQAVADAAQSATDAQDAADSIGRYQGLWPDTGGIADKGDTYQTQVNGSPTGRYFTALQNTTVDPVDDEVNWREVVSVDSFSQYTHITYKPSVGNSAFENMLAGIPLPLNIGDYGSTGSSIWVRVANAGLPSDFRSLSSSTPYDFGWNDLSSVTQNTLALQAAIDNNDRIDIHQEATVNTINLKDNIELNFFGNGKLVGTPGNKILQGLSKSNITINNMNLNGVFDGITSNIAEHGLDLQNCDNVKINNPKGRDIAGNFIRQDRCSDITTKGLDCDNTGFLAYISINGNRDKLLGAYVRRAKDPFSVQSKGGKDSLIDDVIVTEPHSCGVIMNTNSEGGVDYPCVRGRIGKVTILGESLESPIGTKGGVLHQATDGSIGEVYMTGNTKIPQVTIASGSDNTQIGKITVESNTSIGLEVSLNVGTVVIQSLISKGNQDRAVRIRSGKVYILGGEIKDNGQAGVPNVEFIDWEDFIISGVNFIQNSPGTAKNNIKLGVSNGKGLISGNTFERSNSEDVATETGEFRVDCPNVEVHGNNNCYVKVTDGWVERFEIKAGQIVPSGYSRSSAPTTGSWVKGDVIPYSNIAIGSHSEFICVAAPSTFGTRGLIS